MTNSPTHDQLLELVYGLADAEQEPPPARLLELAKVSAYAQRRPGRPFDEPEVTNPKVVFGRCVSALDDLLGTLGEEAWHRHALRDLDVQGLVGHLTGVETDFHRALEDPDGSRREDHVLATQEHALAQRGRAPAATYRDWQLQTRRSVELLEKREISSMICLHELEMPLDELLIVRAFELWTHTEDIQRATNLELTAPDASCLQAMVDLAMKFLPRVLTPDRQSATSTVRLVLTGQAGGTFDVECPPGPPAGTKRKSSRMPSNSVAS